VQNLLPPDPFEKTHVGLLPEASVVLQQAVHLAPLGHRVLVLRRAVLQDLLELLRLAQAALRLHVSGERDSPRREVEFVYSCATRGGDPCLEAMVKGASAREWGMGGGGVFDAGETREGASTWLSEAMKNGFKRARVVLLACVEFLPQQPRKPRLI